jgi:hypothetical protein
VHESAQKAIAAGVAFLLRGGHGADGQSAKRGSDKGAAVGEDLDARIPVDLLKRFRSVVDV